jgi:DNA-binding transcriptional LysR family regulator
MDRGDLANLSAFVTVADQRSFRAAASRLDVTPSALSHSMRQLEARLGVRLLNRTTTRSVSVTDAGQRLLEQLRPALGQISDALEDLNRGRSRPFGRLQIYVTSTAATAVIAPSGNASYRPARRFTSSSSLAKRRSILWRRDSTPVSDPRTVRPPTWSPSE